MIAVVFLLASQAIAEPADLSPFKPFLGACWRADFSPTVHDTHCFEAMYGGAHVRDRHEVQDGSKTIYAGETIYSADGPDLVFAYYNSLGGVGLGKVGSTEKALGFTGSMWVFPRPLVTLFLEDSAANGAVITLAISFLRVAAAFQLVDGAQVIGAGMLRGLHDTRWPLLFALFGYWVVGLGIGSWLAFGQDWKGVGIWIGLASGLAAVAVMMLIRWVSRERIGLTRLAHG